MRKYGIGSFHGLIIAFFLLLFMSGCGYKAPPYIQQETPKSDENVKFIIQEKRFDTDNNESCSDK